MNDLNRNKIKNYTLTRKDGPMEEILILAVLFALFRTCYVVFKPPEPHEKRTLKPNEDATKIEGKKQGDISWTEFFIYGIIFAMWFYYFANIK